MPLFRRRAMTPPRLTLLSRPGCHLCEELHARVAPIVAELGGSVTMVDVDSDPALAARWGEEIPILLDEEGALVAKANDAAWRIRRRLTPP